MARRKAISAPLDARQHSGLTKAGALLEQSRLEIGANSPVRRLQVLTKLGLHGPMSRVQLAVYLDADDGCVMNDLKALGATDRHGKPGRQLVDERWETAEELRFIYSLTQAGRETLERLVGSTTADVETPSI